MKERVTVPRVRRRLRAVGSNPGASTARARTGPTAQGCPQAQRITENGPLLSLAPCVGSVPAVQGKRNAQAGGNSRRLGRWVAASGFCAYRWQKLVAEVAAPGAQGLSDAEEVATMSAFRKPAEHRHPGADKEARVKSDCIEYARVWGMR